MSDLATLLFGDEKAVRPLSPAESVKEMKKDTHWVAVYSSIVIKYFIELLPKVTKLLVSNTF